MRFSYVVIDPLEQFCQQNTGGIRVRKGELGLPDQRALLVGTCASSLIRFRSSEDRPDWCVSHYHGELIRALIASK